ncbi:MAG TPA: LacI family DNA-binding transcriptional regulator [Chloroflexia bacterium]|nr:LacI family DNA-binding transcriptional regulator [Chloroflexia bacterium]
MANIQDVAKLAGVSISTVSRVLNGTAKVNGELRQRVEEAMETLAYQPNPAARSLRTNRSRIIGLLIPDFQNPFFMKLIQGVEDEAHLHDYSLLLYNSNEDIKREQRNLQVLYNERVAGAIIVPTKEQMGTATLKKFRERDIALVAVDRRITDNSIDAVLVDNIRGSREAVGHLIANGYRRIGVITGPTNLTTGRERLEGYQQALQEAGISLDAELVRSGPFTFESGQKLAEELLNLNPVIEAIFACNNVLTLGAVDAVQNRNLRIPDDMALVGFDDVGWAALGSISLSTVIQPAYELGKTAAQRLFHHLQNPGIQTRQEIILAPSLVIRGSSQPRNDLILKRAGT